MEKRKKSEVKFNRLPACVAEYIKLVIKKMRYRRKVQQGVQAELAAHFEDELKECATDEEKEQKAHKLIAEFGDVKLLAILLRRAKKRCRPLWRTVIARTFQTVGIIIVLFCIYTVWFISGKPAINVNYLALLNQMGRPQLRDEDNAWPHYEKAINLYIEPVKDGVVQEFISYRDKPRQLEKVLRFTDLSEDEQGQILEWIQQNQQHWNNLSAEQQKVILKCFQYNWVTIFKKPHLLYSGIPFNSMTSYIIEVIKQKEQVMEPYYTVVGGPEHPGFPDAELTDWIKQDKIPPNYLEAVSVAVLHEWMKRYKDFPKGKWAPLSDSEYEYISPWVIRNGPAWKEFVTASSKSYCYREYKYDPNSKGKLLWDITLPHLRNLRYLSRLGVWRSRIDIKQGQTSRALENCLAIARASSHWQEKETIIEQLVGIAISALAHEQILHIIATQELSATDVKQLQQRLSQIYPESYPLVNIEGERIAFLDIVQHVFTEGGPGGGHLIPQKFGTLMVYIDSGPGLEELGLLIHTAAGMIHARRDETIAKFNEIFDKLSENAKMSPCERHTHNINVDKVILSLPKYRYFLIHIFIPAFDRISELVYRSKAMHEATVTILALKRCQLEKGEYPIRLDELIASGYLNALPMDFYSDKPLVYKKTDDSFILYSLGENFKDDAGQVARDRKGRPRRWADEGDTVFWPVPEMQSD